tara:strand:- start:2002 stop:2640 length:639 start_codon:yes stop_codon:yes gene_type:complete
MGFRGTRASFLALAVMLSILAISTNVSAQYWYGDTRAGGADILFVFCLLPLILFGVVFGLIWGVSYPVMFVIGALTSGSRMDKRMRGLVVREQASIDHFGRDPLSSLRGTHIVGGVAETGLVYSSIVYAPSHWQLLIAWFNNLVGGRVGILHSVVAVARAEAKQRLREKAQEMGWEEVLNVRLDTAEMTPTSAKKGIRAVEIFAYGTGIRYS